VPRRGIEPRNLPIFSRTLYQLSYLGLLRCQSIKRKRFSVECSTTELPRRMSLSVRIYQTEAHRRFSVVCSTTELPRRLRRVGAQF
jgi:hypothetical protein